MVKLSPPDDLLTTKLFVPLVRPDLVRRPRLDARLAAGLRGPLTVVVAPAGSGKTTLLADGWQNALEIGGGVGWHIAWLALDTGDNDLARFLRYVVAAFQTLQSDLGRAALAQLRSPQLPPVEAILGPLLNDLVTLPYDVVLVLDDYHVVEDPAIHRAVAFLLDHLPPRLHLVVATRTEPPLPLARLRARGQLTELRADDLRFTADEAAAFLHRAVGETLSSDELVKLEERTEGWIAGLQLAALALRAHHSAQLADAIAALTGTHRYLLDYLSDEVFARQPDDVRRFLTLTSVLDRMSGPLGETLVGVDGTEPRPGDGQAMLERLEAANLFLVPLDDTRTWYRYHHLFADFLRERLRRDSPDLVPALHRRAAAWYEQQGLVTDAVGHALAGQDHLLAARLIERVSPTLLWQRGELTTLLRWLESLPRDVVASRPRLCLDLTWALLLSGRVDAVEPRLRAVECTLDAQAHPTDRALRGEISALRAELARLRGDSPAAIALARAALADLSPRDRRVRAGTTSFLGSAYLTSGNAVAACETYAEAAALSRTPETITVSLLASGRLILAQARAGRLHRAAATYQETLELATQHGLAETTAFGAAQVGVAEVRREWNDLAAAEDLARRGIERCRAANGMAQMALEGALTLARVLQARGDLAGALATLDEAESHGRKRHVTQTAQRVAVARARLWLTATPGDLVAARCWADARAPAWRADAMLDYLALLERLTLARLHLARGRHADAAALLGVLLDRAEASGLTGQAIEVLVLQARLALEQDNLPDALLALSRALTLAEPEGFVRVFVDEGPAMVALLRLAQARGVASEYVTTLLLACGNPPQEELPAALPLVEPLSPRELELLHLLAAGLSTAELADRLVIAPSTVRNHLKSIFGKLDAHSRLQAVERARTLRLL